MSDLDRILDKIDKIDDRLNSIELALVKQSAYLSEHYSQTLENTQNIQQIQKELKPIQKHMVIVQFASKILGTLVVFLTSFFTYKDFHK